MTDLSYEAARFLCNELLAAFSYKPGWLFGPRDHSSALVARYDYVSRADALGYTFWMTMETPDTWKPGQTTIVGTDGSINLEMICRSLDPRFEFLRALVEQIHSFEAHETLEHARLDGARIFDPHPNGPQGSATRGGHSNYLLPAMVP